MCRLGCGEWGTALIVSLQQQGHGMLRIGIVMGCILAVAGAGLPEAHMGSRQCLHLSYSGDSVFAERIARDLEYALNQHGICTWNPALTRSRSQMSLKAGAIDGEIARIGRYGEMLDDYIFQVSEPVSVVTGYIVSRDPLVTSVAALGDKAIGILRDAVWMEEMVAGRDAVYRTTNVDELYRLLDRGRVGAILVSYHAYEQVQALVDLHNTEVMRQPLYVFLRREHQNLDAVISTAIKDFKAAHGELGQARPVMLP